MFAESLLKKQLGRGYISKQTIIKKNMVSAFAVNPLVTGKRIGIIKRGYDHFNIDGSRVKGEQSSHSADNDFSISQIRAMSTKGSNVDSVKPNFL